MERKGLPLDTAAQRIYDRCCHEYGWDVTKRGLFAKQKPLFSEKATPEEYSAWFLSHNSWTGTCGGHWYNEICRNHINEYWKERCVGNGLPIDRDFTARVVFAKKSDGYYVFLGVFKPEFSISETVLTKDVALKNGHFAKKGEKVWVKKYVEISDKYPVEYLKGQEIKPPTDAVEKCGTVID